MGSKASILLQEQEIEEIHNVTGFSNHQIVRLYSRFTSLDKGNTGSLSREDFLRIPELAINPLGDRIVHAFFSEDTIEHGVNFKQFMTTLARFRPIKNKSSDELNSREEKLKFAFKLYDLDNDGKVSRDELIAVLTMMVGTNIAMDQLSSIADRTVSEADTNKDGEIGFDEFVKVMEKVDVEQKMSIRFLN